MQGQGFRSGPIGGRIGWKNHFKPNVPPNQENPHVLTRVVRDALSKF
jgi:hypothetical protein